MQITTAKLKNADGSFEYLGIGADANYITLKNGENFEEAASEVNNNTSNMDLTYQILDEELKTSMPVDVELNRNIAEFSSRDPQTNVIKTNRAKVKNEDGWSEDIPIAAAAVNIDLNNGNNAEDTFENLEVKLNKLNEKYDELKSLVSTVVEGDPVTVNSSGMDYIDTIVYGNSEQKTTKGKNFFNILSAKKAGTSQTINGITFTFNSDGTISANGTNTEGTQSSFEFTLPDDYAILGTGKKMVMTLEGESMTGGFAFTMRDNSYGNNRILELWNLGTNNMKLIDGIVYNRPRFYTYHDTSFTNVTIKIMIVDSNITDYTYESYTGGQPSPNPDYPQDIEVIDGANLTNLTSISTTSGGYINRTCGIIASVEKDVTYTLTFKNNTTYTNMVGVRTFIGTSYNTEIGKNLIANSQNVFEFTATQTGELALSAKVSEDVENIFTEIMLIKGTTPKPYLPYGYIGLEQSGKNKIGLLTDFVANKSDATVTIEGQNIIIEHKTTAAWAGAVKNITGLPAGETMTISSYVTTSTTTGSGLTVRNSNGDVVKESIRNPSGSNISFSFTVPNDGQISVRLYSGYGDVNVNDNATFSNLQLELGSTVTPYEPYHEPKIIPIDLNGNSIAKVGDVKDLLKVHRNGDVEINKLNNKIVLDGSEPGWNIVNNGFVNSNIIPVHINNAISTHFIYELTTTTWTGINKFGVNIRGNAWFMVDKTKFDTLEKWINFLSANKPEIYYQLAEPQIIKLPSINTVEPWEGTNIFKLITNLDTTMQVDYYKNYEKYVISNIDF